MFIRSHNEDGMKKNLGITDRVLRVVLAFAVVVLYLTNQISGTVAIILGLTAAIFLLTSLMSFCPLYALFGLSTKKEAE
jgi:hypothetical protein